MSTATNTAAFEQEVNEFLAANLTPDLVNSASLGFGISREEGTRWHKALFDKGWIAPDWPSEYGGCDWSTRQKHIFSQATAFAGAPMVMPFGIGMVGPVIYTYGTQAQKTSTCQAYWMAALGGAKVILNPAAVQTLHH